MIPFVVFRTQRLQPEPRARERVGYFEGVGDERVCHAASVWPGGLGYRLTTLGDTAGSGDIYARWGMGSSRYLSHYKVYDR